MDFDESKAIEYIKNISFDKEEIEYLRSLGTFDEELLTMAVRASR